jgi:hypothetical protein
MQNGYVNSDEDLIPWAAIDVTLTLTAAHIVGLIWIIEGSHQEFCTGNCDCDDFAAPLRAALPEGLKA